jgi:hypothetical protein
METMQFSFARILKLLLANKTIRIVFSLASFLAIRIFSAQTNGFSEGPIFCPIRLVTGLPCPACGTTRSIGSIAIGNFEQAWALNPLGFFTFALAIAWAVKPGLITNLLDYINVLSAKINLSKQFIIIILLYICMWLITIFRTRNGIV